MFEKDLSSFSTFVYYFILFIYEQIFVQIYQRIINKELEMNIYMFYFNFYFVLHKLQTNIKWLHKHKLLFLSHCHNLELNQTHTPFLPLVIITCNTLHLHVPIQLTFSHTYTRIAYFQFKICLGTGLTNPAIDFDLKFINFIHGYIFGLIFHIFQME